MNEFSLYAYSEDCSRIMYVLLLVGRMLYVERLVEKELLSQTEFAC